MIPLLKGEGFCYLIVMRRLLGFYLLIVPIALAEPRLAGLSRLHGDLPQALVGQALLNELHCHRCHDPEEASVPTPDLSEVGSRLHAEGIRARLEHPAITMPDPLHALSEEERAATITSLVHYLSSLRASEEATPLEGDPARGALLRQQVGCTACHGPTNESFRAAHYQPEGLTAFLLDPHQARPAGRMPSLQLTLREAADLTAHLQELRPPAASAPPRGGKGIEAGRLAFERHRCAQCHSQEPIWEATAPSWRSAGLESGCLSVTPPAASPRYTLAPWQREALVAALKESASTPAGKDDAPERLHTHLAQWNCVACHERDGLGGVMPDHDPQFTSTNLNLGDQARLPPTLTGVGAKLHPSWLRKVLVEGASVRPYMHTRMPVFARGPMETLSESLSQQDAVLEPFPQPQIEEREAREAGHALVGEKGFGCIACHPYKGRSATTLAAVELTSMTARLQKGWFQQYVREPSRFQPLTIMPSYWPNGQSTRPEILGGDPDKQIEALWNYLSRGREARPPQGVRRDPILLHVAEEAVMLRRQYPGVGKRGIGVGYPAGIHLVFDAGQLRLAALWTGEFVDASGAFRGQGSGNVQPRSRQVVSFPTGPAIARLTSPEEAWPDNEAKKAPGFQFQGYDLDAKRRPTFRYQFGDSAFTDGFVDQLSDAGEPTLVRTLTVSQPSAALYLRVAAHASITFTDGQYRIGDQLTLTPSRPGIIQPAADEKSILMIPLSKATLTIVYEITP